MVVRLENKDIGMRSGKTVSEPVIGIISLTVNRCFVKIGTKFPIGSLPNTIKGASLCPLIL